MEIGDLEFQPGALAILNGMGFVAGLIASFEVTPFNVGPKRKLAESKHPIHNRMSKHIEHYTSLNALLVTDIAVVSGSELVDSISNHDFITIFFLSNPGFYMGLYVGTKLLTPIYGTVYDKIKGIFRRDGSQPVQIKPLHYQQYGYLAQLNLLNEREDYLKTIDTELLATDGFAVTEDSYIQENIKFHSYTTIEQLVKQEA